MQPAATNSASLAVLRTDVDALRVEMKANTDATKELVEAWKAARTFLAFMKFAAGMVTALTAAWLILRAGWNQTFS